MEHFHHLHQRRASHWRSLAAAAHGDDDEHCWLVTWVRVKLNPSMLLCWWHFPLYLSHPTLGCLYWESFCTFPIRLRSELECLLQGDWLSGIIKNSNGYASGRRERWWCGRWKAKSVHSLSGCEREFSTKVVNLSILIVCRCSPLTLLIFNCCCCCRLFSSMRLSKSVDAMVALRPRAEANCCT